MNFLSILLLIFSPIIAGSILLCPLFPQNKIKIRRASKAFSITHFIYSLLFLLFFNATNLGWSYQKELTFFGSSWLKSLGISATFAMDGISLVFVLLTSFIAMLTIISGKTFIKTNPKLFYSFVLFLETIILGLFCAKDAILFFLFWQSEILITYFLISQWSEKSSNITNKYLISNITSSLFLFIGILILYFFSFAINGVLSADIESLSISENIFNMPFKIFVFLCFLIAFLTKLAVFPLHSCMIFVQEKTQTPVSLLFAGLILNIGGYGIIRFNIGLFPEVFNLLASILMILGLINIIYGSFIILSQTNIRKIISYSTLIYSGSILIGLSSLSEIGFSGSIFHMISRSLIYCGLFIIIGCIYLRTKTNDINLLSGLNKILPKCYFLSLFILLSFLMIPFSSSFISQFMIYIGTILSEIEPRGLIVSTIVISIICLIITAGKILCVFHKIFYGDIMPKFYKEENSQIIFPKRGITKSEIIVLSFIVFAIFLIGIFPNYILEIINSKTDIIIDFLKV